MLGVGRRCVGQQEVQVYLKEEERSCHREDDGDGDDDGVEE